MVQIHRINFRLSLFLTVVVSLGLSTAVRALSMDDIDAIASQTTVVIGQGLSKGDIEARREFIPGSGVIIARQGKTYYALTALHVVQTRGVLYGVRTSDGEISFTGEIDSSINYFGENHDKQIKGYDLAIVKFEGTKNYPVATLSRSEVKQGDKVYVSGWPDPEDEIVTRARRTSDGQLELAVTQPFENGGYSLLYSSFTRPGMSGGPVFNSAGEVVGIHGRGRRKGEEYCVDPELNQNNSCGMQIVHFLSETKSRNLRLAFNFEPFTSESILEGKSKKRKADFIEDIYQLFIFDFDTMIRNKPSGGCGSLLLGDKCENSI